jgi:hypothetical protein
MRSKLLTGIAAVAIAGTTAILWAPWASSTPGAASACGTTYSPVLDPAHFVPVVDNPYFPLPVGTTLVYIGKKDGKSQTDRVTVTDRTKEILGITATVVRDVARHHGDLLEKTFDFYAQDDQGTVWYLGEDTTAFEPNGHTDTSGSFVAGVDGAQPGIIMEGDPRIPDAYRQECYAGQAEDTAWVVATTGSSKVPYGKVQHVLTTLESTRIEPGRLRREGLRAGDRHRERARAYRGSRGRTARQRERLARSRPQAADALGQAGPSRIPDFTACQFLRA